MNTRHILALASAVLQVSAIAATIPTDSERTLVRLLEENSSYREEMVETVSDLCRRFPGISPEIAGWASAIKPRWVLKIALAARSVTPSKWMEIRDRCLPSVPDGMTLAFDFAVESNPLKPPVRAPQVGESSKKVEPLPSPAP